MAAHVKKKDHQQHADNSARQCLPPPHVDPFVRPCLSRSQIIRKNIQGPSPDLFSPDSSPLESFPPRRAGILLFARELFMRNHILIGATLGYVTGTYLAEH